MAIIKISELPAADTPLSASDVVPALQDGVTKKAAIDQLGFIADGSGATTRTIQNKLRETVSVKDFGAVGDGVANDTVAVQAAINSLGSDGGVVYFPPGEYRIARNIGVNDRWGIKVTSSNIALKGDQASLRRYDTNITTYANAYPILFVGVPDSNVAAATENIEISNLTFIGENTRHDESGSSQTDFRTAIVFKNTENTLVQNCVFTEIDSSAISYQPIATYNYVTASYYNTTKNYRSQISSCNFIAHPHATPGRALLHCINANGIDYLLIDGNNFEWTDVCLSGETTYNRADQSENDTFTYSSPASRVALGAVKRQAKNVTFSNNNCFNCSEHPLYPAMVNVVISGNNISTDQPLICDSNPIQTRCRTVSITGNTISGYSSAIALNAPTSQATVSGNTFIANDLYDREAAAVGIYASGLESYISNRSDYLTYIPMDDFSITGNVLVGPPTFAPTGPDYQVGFRISSTSASANFPDGYVNNVSVVGNTFRNWQNACFFIYAGQKNVVVNGNSIYGKSFVTAGFNGSTTMVTRAVILLYGVNIDEARRVTFTNNYVYGSKYLIASRFGSGTPNSLYPPEQFSNNKLDYIQNTKTADVRAFDALSNFRGNVSLAYLDRSFSNTSLFNSLLSSGAGTNSEIKYNAIYVSGNNTLRFYYDDNGNYISPAAPLNGGTANGVVYYDATQLAQANANLTYNGTKFGVVGFTESGSTNTGTAGQIVIRSRELTDETRASIGVLRSSGATYLGRYLEPSTTIADGFNGGITATTGGGAWVISIDGSTRYEGFASTSITKGSPVSTTKWFEISPTGKTTLYGEVEATGTIESGNTADGTVGQITIRSRESQNFTNASIGATYSSGAAYLGRAVEPSQSVLNGFNGGFTGTTGGGAWIIDNDGSTSFLSVPSVAMTKGSAVTTYPRLKIDLSGNVLNIGPGGLGYGTGSGGAVTQGTSRTTGVTLDKTNGAITLFSAAGTTVWQTFTVTNSTVAATDTVIVNQKSGTDLYLIHVTKVAAGSFNITFATTGGTTTEQPVFNFAVIKAVTA